MKLSISQLTLAKLAQSGMHESVTQEGWPPVGYKGFEHHKIIKCDCTVLVICLHLFTSIYTSKYFFIDHQYKAYSQLFNICTGELFVEPDLFISNLRT